MDYHRIYREFIADRKTKPKPDGYTERHHILPRSLGGGNDPANLIDLTAEDHFFAHLLLAKIHGGAMWRPVFFMGKWRPEDEKAAIRRRVMYAIARKQFAVESSARQKGRPGRRGADNGMFSADLLTWTNVDTGEVRTATMAAMAAATGTSRSIWTLAATRPGFTAVGWTATPGAVRCRSFKGRTLVFVNRDGRQFRGTQSEFMKETGVNAATASRVSRASSVTRCGWRLDGAIDRAPYAPKNGSGHWRNSLSR